MVAPNEFALFGDGATVGECFWAGCAKTGAALGVGEAGGVGYVGGLGAHDALDQGCFVCHII